MFGLSRVIAWIAQEKSLDAISQPLSAWASKATDPDVVKYALSGSWLGHQLHPMVSDIPIGAWAMASALDLTGGKPMRGASQRLVGIGILSALPAIASGASDWAESYGKEQRVGVVHALANSGGLALQALSWVARRKQYHVVGVGLSLVGFGLTAGAGYLGGHLSFGMGVGVNHTAFQARSKQWSDVAAEDEVQEGQLVRVMVKSTPVVLTRHDGEVRALSATCSHAGGPLHKGSVEDGCIVCPWHHSKFRISDGVPMRGPAGTAQPTWQVRAEDGRISVRGTD